MFVSRFRELFVSKSDIHDKNIRYNLNLHHPSTNLKLVQRGVLYLGIKFFNHLPISIKLLFKDPMHFKIKLRSFLMKHSLCSLEEYFSVTPNETYITNKLNILNTKRII